MRAAQRGVLVTPTLAAEATQRWLLRRDVGSVASVTRRRREIVNGLTAKQILAGLDTPPRVSQISAKGVSRTQGGAELIHVVNLQGMAGS